MHLLHILKSHSISGTKEFWKENLILYFDMDHEKYLFIQGHINVPACISTFNNLSILEQNN